MQCVDSDDLCSQTIFTILDEATQQPKLETNDDKISCSPDEIEQKRLAAIAKRKQKLKTWRKDDVETRMVSMWNISDKMPKQQDCQWKNYPAVVL